MDYRESASYLLERDQFLIVTHRRPDGDTLGSAAALCHALRRLGKTAQLYCNPEITDAYVPFVSPYLAPEGYAPDCTVSVDVAEASMLAQGFAGTVDMMIDHHIPRTPICEHTLIHSEKASCGEIILELLDALGLAPDKEEADLLYIAVSTDTGCFCYANTRGDTFRTAACLLDAGADLPALNKLFFRTKTRARLTLEGLIFSSLRSYRDNRINIAIITLDMLERSGAVEDDCSDLANLAGQVKENRVAVTVREISLEPPMSKISLRTDGSVDASALCARFGGGGHKMASGCELAMSPDEAAETIRRAVEEVWA